MILYKKAADLRNYLDAQLVKEIRVGFVPTMGALHDGHISLVNASRKDNGITVCSIFVNPTQFNDPADLEKYPVTIEEDISKLELAGCDLLFLPSVREMYPTGLEPSKKYELGYLEKILEGKHRPGHFQGVCQVVERLLEIINPHRLYLGQKDYQQCLVIKRLLELTGKTSIELIISPTVREPDGLAMSSRNKRLNDTTRSLAPLIHQTLSELRSNIGKEDIEKLKLQVMRKLIENGFTVDYIEVADAEDLQPVEKAAGNRPLVALAAASIDGVRLIDNIAL